MSGLASNAKKRGDKAEALRWYARGVREERRPGDPAAVGRELHRHADRARAARRGGDRGRDDRALQRSRGAARRVLRAERPLAAEGRREAAGVEQGRRAPRGDGAPRGEARDALRRTFAQRQRARDLPRAAQRAGEADRVAARPQASTSVDAHERSARLSTAPLLAIEHLTVRFGATAVVDDVSLTIGAGEKFALVGESGSGKSITALSVLGLVDGASTSGRDRLRRRRPAHARRAADARGARRRDRDDLPGADDRAQPAAHGRRADRRGARPAREARPRRGARSARSPCSRAPASPSPSGASMRTRTSSRAASGSGR